MLNRGYVIFYTKNGSIFVFTLITLKKEAIIWSILFIAKNWPFCFNLYITQLFTFIFPRKRSLNRYWLKFYNQSQRKLWTKTKNLSILAEFKDDFIQLFLLFCKYFCSFIQLCVFKAFSTSLYPCSNRKRKIVNT